MPGAADLGKLFGRNGVGEQLLVFGLLQQLLAAVLAPELEMLTRGVNEVLQATPLSPAELADMVNRAIVSEGDASAYAKQSGVSPSDFARLVEAAGEAPAVGDLVEALRRDIIPEHGSGPDAVSFEQGIKETRVRNKWTAMLRQLGVKQPSPGDALDALLQGQLPEDRARELYALFGGDPEHFTWLFDTRGQGPTPTEAAEMANRGVIPWEGQGPDVTSFEQAFLEGPDRNKWLPAWRAIATALPPARTTTALLRNGTIDDATAADWFRRTGLSPDAAQAYVEDAHHVKAQSARELAKGDILQLYRDQMISAEQATAWLRQWGLAPDQVALELAAQDQRRAIQAVDQVVSRLHTLYVNRKIGKDDVTQAFGQIGLPAPQQDQLLANWDVERGANVKVLSAAEVASAFFYQVIDQSEATAELVGQGYTPRDAWILLSVRVHKPLPNPPAPGIGG